MSKRIGKGIWLYLFLAGLATLLAQNVSAQSDYQSLISEADSVPKPRGNLDATSRHFAILKAVDIERQRVVLLIEGETEPKQWNLTSGAELWCDGWWARLDRFTVGDRVWIWFAKDSSQHPVSVALMSDELSEQSLYEAFRVKEVVVSSPGGGVLTLESERAKNPLLRTVKLAKAEVYRGDSQEPQDSLKVGETLYVQTTGEDARLILDRDAFEKRQAAAKALLRNRWANEGLPGTLIFLHPDRDEVELMLDHEAIFWARSLKAGDSVFLETSNHIPAAVQQLRPRHERTQILLSLDGSELTAFSTGQRANLRLVASPQVVDDEFPTALDRTDDKAERVERIMASIYCTCLMNDVCAGHIFTLAACDSGPGHTCGLAKRTRQELAEMIDQGHTDREILEKLLKERGPNLVRPHMLP